MDRFDCQFLMATFVNVYISSFIRTASPQKLLAQVCDFIHFLTTNSSHHLNRIQLGLQFETRATIAIISSSQR